MNQLYTLTLNRAQENGRIREWHQEVDSLTYIIIADDGTVLHYDANKIQPFCEGLLVGDPTVERVS